MRKFVSLLRIIAIFVALTTFAGASDKQVRLSSTIGPVDAGLVPLLAAEYEKDTGVKVLYEKAGTGATLDKAKKGGFDLVMVHARELEDKFIADGYGIKRYDIMYNDFIILGPKADPAGIKGMKSAADAFKAIAKKQVHFISRGDKSGTHIKEEDIWKKAGVTPSGSWYEVFADGAKGNKATTLYTDEKQAYTLMDRATYLTVKDSIKLVPLVENDEILLNYIAVISVNPDKVSGANLKAADDFIKWLTGTRGQSIIKTFGVKEYGEPLFFPNAK